MKSPAESARTWKGNDYQAVWWDEAQQVEDRIARLKRHCTDDMSNAIDRMLTAWDHAEIRGKFWAGKLPDTELEAALSSKVDQ